LFIREEAIADEGKLLLFTKKTFASINTGECIALSVNISSIQVCQYKIPSWQRLYLYDEVAVEAGVQLKRQDIYHLEKVINPDSNSAKLGV